MIIKSHEEPDKALYPDSDGQPMAENTLQLEWIITIEGNLDALFRHDPNVFVAGDLLWYAVEGEPTIRTAPDALVVFGRPKGHRGSYRQWREEGIPPQVVFEILSPGNRDEEMARKFEFYERYGVEEYYLYDPDGIVLSGWRRIEGRLQPIESMHDWISPRLGIRFDLSGEDLVVYRPDGERFYTFVELKALQERDHHRAEQTQRQFEQVLQQMEQTQRQAEQALQQMEQTQRQAEQTKRQFEQALQQTEQAQRQTEQALQRVEQERQRAERLAAQLRVLGIEPEA